MRRRSRRVSRALFVPALCLAFLAGLSLARAATVDLSSLGKAEAVAPGIELYRVSDQALLAPPGPVAVQLLRIDPGRAHLDLGARA